MRNRAIWLSILLVVVLLSVRVVLFASKLETGWDTLAISWLNSTMGLIIGERKPIAEWLPKDQADYWLPLACAEFNHEQPISARLMGAALALDSPGVDYLKYFMKPVEGRGVFGTFVLPPDLDHEGVKQSLAAYDQRTGKLCLDLAEAATAEDPSNVNWWRLRAMMQFRNHLYGESLQPRSGNWQPVLQECREHDQDNGIYDLMEALVLWKEAGRWDWVSDSTSDEDTYELRINDAKLFKDASIAFERVMDCQLISVGEGGMTATDVFLGNTHGWSIDKSRIAGSRPIHTRLQTCLIEISRWLSAIAESELDSGNLLRSKQILFNKLYINDKVVTAQESSAFDPVPIAIAQSALAELDSLHKAHTDLFSDEESEKLEDLSKVWRNRMDSLRILSNKRSSQQKQLALNFSTSILVGIAQMSVGLLVDILFVCLLLYILIRLHVVPVHAISRWYEHVGIWIIAYPVSIFLLGICPTDILQLKTQRWIIAGVTAVVVLAAITVFLIRSMREHGFRYRLRSLFIAMTLMGLLAMLWTGLELQNADWEGIFPEGAREANFGPITAEQFRAIFQMNKQSVEWVVLQWLGHYGQYVSIAIGFSLLLLLFIFRWTQLTEKDVGLKKFRQCLRSFVQCFRRSAVGLGLIWFVVYLWCAPPVLRATENEYQRLMKYIRNPRSHWNEIQIELEKIEAERRVDKTK